VSDTMRAGLAVPRWVTQTGFGNSK
jgi:hypothetical protein